MVSLQEGLAKKEKELDSKEKEVKDLENKMGLELKNKEEELKEKENKVEVVQLEFINFKKEAMGFQKEKEVNTLRYIIV